MCVCVFINEAKDEKKFLNKQQNCCAVWLVYIYKCVCLWVFFGAFKYFIFLLWNEKEKHVDMRQRNDVYNDENVVNDDDDDNDGGGGGD